jgi:hypothetical protein
MNDILPSSLPVHQSVFNDTSDLYANGAKISLVGCGSGNSSDGSEFDDLDEPQSIRQEMFTGAKEVAVENGVLTMVAGRQSNTHHYANDTSTGNSEMTDGNTEGRNSGNITQKKSPLYKWIPRRRNRGKQDNIPT